MSAPPPAPAPKPSGSETRQRGKGAVLVRLLPTERATLEEKAQAAQLSLASYLRTCGLGSAGPRAQRRSSIDAVALAETVMHLHKVGSHLDEIARTLATTDATATAQKTEAAVAETCAILAQIRALVGRKTRA
jgi:hypothetical protein